ACVHERSRDLHPKLSAGKVRRCALADRTASDPDADHRLVKPRLVRSGGFALTAGNMAVERKCTRSRGASRNRDGRADWGARVPDLRAICCRIQIVIEQ